MASGSGGPKSSASILLIVNLVLYFVVIVIASWAVNHGIQRSRDTASVLSIPARIFPIDFPFGNMATGFFVIFSLLAGVVGLATSLTGLHNVFQWDGPNLHTAAASSLTTLSLTLLAMGLACKEIELCWTDSSLRTLETITIIVSATQLFSTCAIHVGVEDVLLEKGAALEELNPGDVHLLHFIYIIIGVSSNTICIMGAVFISTFFSLIPSFVLDFKAL